MEDRFCVGVITKPHGIKGAVTVYPLTDDPDRLSELESITAVKDNKEIELKPLNISAKGDLLLVTFEGINDRNAAEELRDYELYVDREHAVSLSEDEYYVADLIGMKVYDKSGLEGTIKDVYRTGANDVYELKLTDGREVLIPAIKSCILEVDIDAQVMKTDIPEGLI